MRILAIGLGGAGCRIVNNLYATDRRSSKVVCVQALAVDVDTNTLTQLNGLPETAKLFFPPLDPELQTGQIEESQTATIDVGEIVSHIHNIGSEETDALFVCLGLGGSLVDIAPHVITALRSSIVEPIFGLVTLPCLAEGEKRSAKAADDLDMLSPLLDGIILFDNETWYKKIKALKSTLVKKEKGFSERFGLSKKRPEISPQTATYELLNEAIVRRISLILRAGEFKADGGLDSAEVVLDSGEVLNTMKGMGYITIGYAVERLPNHPLSFLTGWRPATGLFADAHKIKASRIVDLAKQAIYHEISTPCDMTSAHKALILIAGPSHELSLKGFMTVRKWIDRSIAGLETRSGDYPVMNTKNVAIIIMLSGLENIPRITELKEIQKQYKARLRESVAEFKESESDTFALSGGAEIISEGEEIANIQEKEMVRDEILILPGASAKKGKLHPSDSVPFSNQTRKESDEDIGAVEGIKYPQKTVPGITTSGKKNAHYYTKKPQITEETIPGLSKDRENTEKSSGSPISRHQVIVAEDHTQKIRKSTSLISSEIPSLHGLSKIKKSSHPSDSWGSNEKHGVHTTNEQMKTKEMERQIIEKELHRQRMKAISGRTLKGESNKPVPGPAPEITKLKREGTGKTTQEKEKDVSAEITEQTPKKRTVLIQKKKVQVLAQNFVDQQEELREIHPIDEEISKLSGIEGTVVPSGSEKSKIEFKNTANKSDDAVLKGKNIQRTEPLRVRNSSLLHTDLKSKKTPGGSKNTGSEKESDEPAPESPKTQGNKEKSNTKKDDFSWI